MPAAITNEPAIARIAQGGSVTSRNDARLIPFLLEDVAAVPELTQADGVHPNPAGHKIIADNVWRYIQPILVQLADRTPETETRER